MMTISKKQKRLEILWVDIASLLRNGGVMEIRNVALEPRVIT